MKVHTIRRCSAHLATSALVALVMLGCRTAREQSALAQVTDSRAERVPTAGPVGEGLPGVSVRRVWAGTYLDFFASSISPDGRYLSLTDWRTSDLAVRDLHTGELHVLTDSRQAEGDRYQAAITSVFSRDGRQIGVSWQYGSDFQLRVRDFAPHEDGIERVVAPRLLYGNPEYVPYYLQDWSPDGGELLAKVYFGNTTQLALIGTADGTYRGLKSFDWREPMTAAFSPDGRFVAYDFEPEVDSSNRDVFVLSVDGSQDTRIVEGSAMDQLLGWHPDGSVLFHSDRGGTGGVWRVPVTNGQRSGPPELVKADVLGVEPLGMAGDRFYYGVNADPRRLYMTTVDIVAGRTGRPQLMVDRDHVQGWDWSADGEVVAYSMQRPGVLRTSWVGVRTVDGEETTIPVDLQPTRQIRWHPDQRSLVLFTYDAKRRLGYYRLDLTSGTHETILDADALEEEVTRGGFAFSPDGGTLYYPRRKPAVHRGNMIEVVARTLETGDERRVADIFWPGRFAMSPDGERLLVMALAPSSGCGEFRITIGTVPGAGGELTTLHQLDGGSVGGLEWTPDGQYALFSTVMGGTVTGLWRVSAAGGDSKRIEGIENVEGIDPRVLRVHPDGQRFTFLAGGSRGEVWVMEGLNQDVDAPSGAHQTSR